MLTITGCDVRLLAIDLDIPFVLGFGSLSTLPRVLIRLTGEERGRTWEGVGEASIDFPFVGYDMWDVYHSLMQLQLLQRVYPESDPMDLCIQNRNRRQAGKLPLPPPLPLTAEEQVQLEVFPAGLAAITMACDDLWGRAYDIPLRALGTGRDRGRAMVSLGFNNPKSVAIKVNDLLKQGLIPKIKLGRGLQEDLDTLTAVERSLDVRRGRSMITADMNGSYTLDQASDVVQAIRRHGLTLRHLVALEQPITATVPLRTQRFVRQLLKDELGWAGTLIADESVVTLEDARICSEIGWAVNYKAQKIGGLRQALTIAETTVLAPGMVGGTFPTAVGRAYDLWVVSALPNATLPSDAWEPSTDWFTGERHLIAEAFHIDTHHKTHPFKGPGLGIHVDWQKVARFVLKDPRSEYHAIRFDRSDRHGQRLRITLRPGQSYAGLYREKTGRSPDWNL